MVESLLKLVQIIGAHVATGKKSTAAWNEINKRFFELEELTPFKEKHYEHNKEDFCKLRDKFNTTMEEVTRDISSGNQSGKEGDLSPIYQLVRQINYEIEDADEEATAAKEKKECDQQQLANNEKAILSQNGTKRKGNRNTAIKVKDVDGTITVDEEREKKRKLSKIPTFESMLITYINAEMADKGDSMDGVRKKMELWINTNNCTTQSFIEAAFWRTRKPPPDDLHDIIEGSGGLELLISVYCDVRDKFVMGKFVEVCETWESLLWMHACCL
jgi:hypothetical protein